MPHRPGACRGRSLLVTASLLLVICSHQRLYYVHYFPHKPYAGCKDPQQWRNLENEENVRSWSLITQLQNYHQATYNSKTKRFWEIWDAMRICIFLIKALCSHIIISNARRCKGYVMCQEDNIEDRTVGYLHTVIDARLVQSWSSNNTSRFC